jgi:hypothetical protein
MTEYRKSFPVHDVVERVLVGQTLKYGLIAETVLCGRTNNPQGLYGLAAVMWKQLNDLVVSARFEAEGGQVTCIVEVSDG